MMNLLTLRLRDEVSEGTYLAGLMIMCGLIILLVGYGLLLKSNLLDGLVIVALGSTNILFALKILRKVTEWKVL